MSKPSPRKQKKQKERERQNRTKKLAFDRRWLVHARKAEYSLKYPGFCYDTTNGDPAFVEVVKKAVAQINFEDESVFPKWEAEIYRNIKQGGWSAGWAALREMLADAEEAIRYVM